MSEIPGYSSGQQPDTTEVGIGRLEFLKRAAVLGGAAAGAEFILLGLPRLSVSAPSASQDRAIFGFMLLLEDIQSAFYAKALSVGELKGAQLQFARTVSAQEHAHLLYLRAQHGAAGLTVPTIHIAASATEASGFVAAAVALEELGLGAYNGQAPNLTPEALRHAGRIISVEARHVAWARSLSGELPAPTASDVPLTEAEVLSKAKERGYVS